MITNDEKSEFDAPSFKAQSNKSPNWEEIESLLKFAEELKTKNDTSYDSIFLFNWLQVFIILVSFFVLIFLWCHIKVFPRINSAYSSPDFIRGAIALFFLFIGFVASEKYLRKIRRRIKSDSRVLGLIVDLLRENSRLITSNLSDLQKIQLKICMSRFDIGIGSSIPIHWSVNLLKLFLPGLFR
jgi:hypothetical protein